MQWIKKKGHRFWFSLVVCAFIVAYIGYSSYENHKCNVEFNTELSARARIADEDTKLRQQFWIAIQQWADKKAKSPWSLQPNINQQAAAQLDEIVNQASKLLDERVAHPLPPTQCGATTSAPTSQIKDSNAGNGLFAAGLLHLLQDDKARFPA